MYYMPQTTLFLYPEILQLTVPPPFKDWISAAETTGLTSNN